MASAVGPQADSTRVSEPAWSFPGKPHPPRAPAVPGVGTYEAPSSLGKQVTSMAATSPILSFGAKTNVPQDSLRVPGPGTYESPDAFGKQPRSTKTSAPAFTMKSRVAQRATTLSPGPGAYNEPGAVGRQPVRRNAPNYSMQGRPVASPRDSVPGPGEHETAVPASGKQPLSTHMTSPAYTMTGRRFRKLKDEADANGPGMCRSDGAFGKQPYSVKRSAPNFSFGSRTAGAYSPITSKNPGPGAHELRPVAMGTQVNSRVRSSPAYSLGARIPQRIDFAKPGPGAYENPGAIGAQALSAKQTAPAYKFGADNSRARAFTQSAGPGPGAYEEFEPVGSGGARRKGVTMKGREKFGSHTQPSDIPGPGAYNSPQTRTARRKAPPAFSFPSSPRNRSKGSDVPGPGHYERPRPRTSQRFSIASRHRIAKKQWEREGPGRCREKSMFGKQVDSGKKSHGGFTFGSRFKTRERETTPGPGAYMEFSRGVRSVPLGRKLNLTGKKPRRRRRRRRDGARSAPGSRATSPAKQGHPRSASRPERNGRSLREPSSAYDEADEYDVGM